MRRFAPPAARWCAAGGLLLIVVFIAGIGLLRPKLIGRLYVLRANVRKSHAEEAAARDPQIRKLLDAMADPRGDAGVRSRDALSALGRPVVPMLIERLQHPDPHMRTSAALVLGNIGEAVAVGPLCRALGDADAGVRYRAAYALGRLKDPQAVFSLAPLLLDASSDVTDVVLRALEECRCKVRLRTPQPGYQILPPGAGEWEDVIPAFGPRRNPASSRGSLAGSRA